MFIVHRDSGNVGSSQLRVCTTLTQEVYPIARHISLQPCAAALIREPGKSVHETAFTDQWVCTFSRASDRKKKKKRIPSTEFVGSWRFP
jgi:hypothetical protein